MVGNKMLRTMWLTSAAMMLVVTSASIAGLRDSLRTVEITSDITFPTFLTAAPGDDERLFVTERAGRIRIIKNGVLLEDPFLDIAAQVGQVVEGAMGAVAFHPEYQTNGGFYVTYTDLAGDGVIARFNVGADADHADPTSEELVLMVEEPGDVHNIGWLGFGPDGYLYIGSGDGVNNNGRFAQDLDKLLGKILRIDVDRGSPYAIPSDNPFVGREGLDEIWALGLRNPWRCSFDRENGDFWIGDVGKSSYEEIDFWPVDSTETANFGWNCMEGNHCFDDGKDCLCNDSLLIDPVFDYDHGVGCAVIGGYVYRGSAVPPLTGLYVYGDVCAPNVWAFDPVAGTSTEIIDGLLGTYSFGEDRDGELYVLGPFSVKKIVLVDCNENGVADGDDIESGDSDDCNVNLVPDECEGDCNGNGIPDDCDLASGTSTDDNGNGVPDECDELADFDGDGLVGVGDLLIMLGAWGPCPGKPDPCLPDLNDDGLVAVADLLILLGRWDT